jgi:pimeloyl-ACP methyl ester carboxylesterase
MKIFKVLIVFLTASMLGVTSLYATTSINQNPMAKALQTNSHFAEVNGIQLHYIEMGKGLLVILLHGWPETSFSWKETISVLSDKYRVVAPDLRGLGLSERTEGGYDKKTIATDIKALVESLGETQAVIIGHDMGGKVAYVMAHLYPESVSKLVLADCLIPGTENADALHGGAWHYGFHMAPEFPEMLTQGREKEYIQAQIKAWSFKKDAISDEAIDEYAKHYSTKGGMTAGFNYYRTLKEDAVFAKTFEGKKLSMPVLTISGRHGVGDKLSKALENETISLNSIIIEDSGHFVAEEAPEIFNKAVIKFLDEEK